MQTGKPKVKQTERGWAGHYILAHKCLFRRNTLLEYKNIKIVVSTVGRKISAKIAEWDVVYDVEEIGVDRYYETMAFHADKNNKNLDADVTKQIYFEGEWSISEKNASVEANEMHEAAVLWISNKLLEGCKFPVPMLGFLTPELREAAKHFKENAQNESEESYELRKEASRECSEKLLNEMLQEASKYDPNLPQSKLFNIELDFFDNDLCFHMLREAAKYDSGLPQSKPFNINLDVPDV